MAYRHHALSTQYFKVNRPYNSSTKILVSFPQAGVSHGELEGLFAVVCCGGGWNKLIIKFDSETALFLACMKCPVSSVRVAVMLSGRYSRTAPESGLSPRWWRYGNQLSNGWITAIRDDKDAHQNQMLLAFPPIRSQEQGSCRRRRRPTVNGGTTASLSDTRLWPLRNSRTTVEEKNRRKTAKT